MAVSAKAEACHAGNGRQRRMSTLRPFAHSVLVESGDSIAALHMGLDWIGVDGIGGEWMGLEWSGGERRGADEHGSAGTF
jgi:hypothetical protein